jgi:hypothetical protein
MSRASFFSRRDRPLARRGDAVARRLTTMPPCMADVACTGPRGKVVPKPVEFPEVVAIESVENAQEVPLLIASDAGVLIKVAA